MKFTMTDEKGNKKIVRTGAGWYTLIPFGNLVLPIFRKQFKVFTLNLLLVFGILSISFSVLSILNTIILLSEVHILALLELPEITVLITIGITVIVVLCLVYLLQLLVMYIFYLFFPVYVFINLVKNINNYTYNDYIKKGYEIDEIYKDNLEVKIFVERSQRKTASIKRGIIVI